ncbi:MAG: nuclear transport factor 2 family protein [Bacteroidota bacterium]
MTAPGRNEPGGEDPSAVAVRFHDCINRHDPGGPAALKTEDHVFVDRDLTRHGPREIMAGNWREFFRMFPACRNSFTRVETRGDRAVMAGRAFWSDENPKDTGLWTALIAGGLVKEWQVCEDTVERRGELELP